MNFRFALLNLKCNKNNNIEHKKQSKITTKKEKKKRILQSDKKKIEKKFMILVSVSDYRMIAKILCGKNDCKKTIGTITSTNDIVYIPLKNNIVKISIVLQYG